MTRRGGRLRPLTALLCSAAALALPACSTRVAFKQDHRVDIQFPKSRQKVTLPMTVRWTAHDFAVTGPTSTARAGSGYFAVFVDRSPQPPGEKLTWFARNDRSCKRSPGCPDEDYLARRNIFQVEANSFPIDALPAPARGVKGPDIHEVTVVLVDGTGRRVGETGFAVEFEVRRRGR